MSIRVLSVLLFFSLYGWSSEVKTPRFKIGTTWVQFYQDDSQRLLISGCNQVRGFFDCEAVLQMKKASIKTVRSQLAGGKNPGAVVCWSIAGARVVLGKDENGAERSFCQFKDKSLLDNGTLAFYGAKNDSIPK